MPETMLQTCAHICRVFVGFGGQYRKLDLDLKNPSLISTQVPISGFMKVEYCMILPFGLLCLPLLLVGSLW